MKVPARNRSQQILNMLGIGGIILDQKQRAAPRVDDHVFGQLGETVGRPFERTRCWWRVGRRHPNFRLLRPIRSEFEKKEPDHPDRRRGAKF